MERVDEREKLQKLLSEIGGHRELLELLRQQLLSLSNTASELTTTRESLGVLKELEPDTSILVPIGSDSFISAKLPRLERVVVGLGAETAADRTPDEAMEILKARAEEVERAMRRTREQLEKLEERIRALAPEAERLLRKLNEEQAKRRETKDV
jgi:prefoldin alpha subunit